MSFTSGWAGVLVSSSGGTGRVSGGTLQSSRLDLCIDEESVALFVTVAVLELSPVTLLVTESVVVVGGTGK